MQVRVVAETHPLFGQLLDATGFKRMSGVVHLVVVLPGGSPGTIPADATGVFGDPDPAEGPPVTVLTAEGVVALRCLVEALSHQR